MRPELASEILLNGWFAADSMSGALQRVAESAGCEGATLTYSHGATQFGAVTSTALLDHVAPYLSANRPPDPRPARVNPTLGEGFRLDQDDFSPREMATDPYYQDFLRPRGFGWHACALLAGAPGTETVTLTLRRTTRQGAFDQPSLEMLAAQLPLIRATASVVRLMSAPMGAAGEDEARRTLIGFDAAGGAFVAHKGLGMEEVVQVRRGRLTAADPAQSPRLAATIARARALSRQTASVLTDSRGDWWLISIVPASAMVPAWMTPFTSWVVLVPYGRSDAASLARLRQMADLFGLSPAEARVAALIGEARTIPAAARLLGASEGTVRNHLKSVFAKVGVGRQAELVAILSRL